MEHVPRSLLRWALIFVLGIWVVVLTTIGWGVWQTYVKSEHDLIKTFAQPMHRK